MKYIFLSMLCLFFPYNPIPMYHVPGQATEEVIPCLPCEKGAPFSYKLAYANPADQCKLRLSMCKFFS